MAFFPSLAPLRFFTMGLCMHESGFHAELTKQHNREIFFQVRNMIVIDMHNTFENTAQYHTALLYAISTTPHFSNSYSLGDSDHLDYIHAAMNLEFSHPK